jgi:hypothetical protein
MYKCLMEMGCEGRGGGMKSLGFGRTISLKLNMQLDAETMRNSLEADWELLTPSQKQKLTHSSFKPRPASAEAIEMLKSGSTTCTCGQTAPVDFPAANPLCCARGTTLAFTWTRGGTLEVRLNGALVDEFDDAGMARAIFYEYLREDDPISPDFRAKVVEGFPSVLAPVLQLKDVNLGVGGGEERRKRKDGKAQHLKPRLQAFAMPTLGTANLRRAIEGALGALRTSAKEAVWEIEGLAEGVKRAALAKIRGGGRTQGMEAAEGGGTKEEPREEEGKRQTFQDLATHFYLLLLLMVSLPPVGTREKKVVVVWRTRQRSARRMDTIWEEPRKGGKGKGLKKSLSWCF